MNDPLEALGREYAMNMTQPTPLQVFLKLVKVMGEDNGCIFSFTPELQADAVRYIQEMQNAGTVFPDPASHESDSLDGIYWQIAAGEEDEVHKEYDEIPGFAGLNVTLGEIFNAAEEWHGILKIQRPLNSQAPVILVYSKNRTIEATIEISKEEMDFMFSDGKVKIYANAALIQGIIHIYNPVPDQPW